MQNKDAPVLRAEITVLLAKDAIEPVPLANIKSGFYSPYFSICKKRWWVITNLGPVSPEPGPSQALVQDANAETHFSMHPSSRLVCSNRPEGFVLFCLDSPSAQAISLLCIRGTSISVQGHPLRAVPVASCLHKSCGGSPHSLEGSRHSHPQSMTGSFLRSHKISCANTGTWCHLGLLVNWEKSKLSPVQKISFLGMELIRSTSQGVSQPSVLSRC